MYKYKEEFVMYNPMEISRIDRQIEDLQRLKASYQNIPQQPINNIINTPTPVATQPIFEAKFTTENPADIYVANKTAFIDLKNGKLTIKEVDGEIKEYFLILPKDEKDLKIENLERKLREMETRINNYSTNTVDTINNTTNTYNMSDNSDNNDSMPDDKVDKKNNNKFKFKN